MSSSQIVRFRLSLRMIAVSIAMFFSAFLFVMPGICSGPGLLGIDAEWAGMLGIGLLLAGMIGTTLGAVWLFASVFLRATGLLHPKED
jgi:hypothetical protein